MGDDDDADCVEHVWGLVEVVLTSRGAEKVKECARCHAIVHVPSQATSRDRPPL